MASKGQKFKKKICEAAEDYKKKSDYYTKAKGKA